MVSDITQEKLKRQNWFPYTALASSPLYQWENVKMPHFVADNVKGEIG